jgi:hypothetical protein
MKTIAFVAAFLSVMALSVPHIATADPEPVGASFSLYLLGLMPLIAGIVAFSHSASRRLLPCRWLVGLCTGALSSGIFFSSIAFAFPVLSFAIVAIVGSLAAVLFSWVVPRFFSVRPNIAFNPDALKRAG